MVRPPVFGEARICGVIGDPIGHTLSPLMHNAAFEELGLDYLYVPFRVKPEELQAAINGMRALNIRGLNVTIPHKVAVIPFLDEIDPLAEKIGAVNTITNDNGILKGDNTDATGFIQALLESGVEPEGKNIVVLGAGGAARAITLSLSERGANLVIMNRQLEFDWAEAVAQQVTQISGKEVKALVLNEANLAAVLKKADILVNATSVGMSPNTGDTPVPAGLIRPGIAVFDIIYNPLKTRLLVAAEAAGAKTINGVDMLVWQGAFAFEMWTGLKAPVEIMKEVVVKELKET